MWRDGFLSATGTKVGARREGERPREPRFGLVSREVRKVREGGGGIVSRRGAETQSVGDEGWGMRDEEEVERRRPAVL